MAQNETSEAKAIAYPFESHPIDCVAQTGADWYRLMLAASLGGKAVHGLNPTPSCEMISKVTEHFALKYSTARIRFSPQVKKVPTLSDDISDQHYVHKDFKGICSGTGSFFSFDQGLWEPSMKKRAREASILAATIASHTNDKEGACDIVGKITGDKIDEAAVDVAIVPVSHLKRDVIAVSKRSHRVFSCGEIQRAITWDDTQLASEKLPESAAMDWGRVIALARTLAEGNIQIDPNFVEYASALGVPYALVKGSYAYVTYGDYVFDPKKFQNVPTVDLGKYMIPSLKDAYSHAAESILRQCYVNLSRLSYTESSASAAKILEIVRECKIRTKGKLPRKVGWAETDILSGPIGHTIDTYEAARIAAQKGTAHNAFSAVVTRKIHESANLCRLAKIYAVSRQGGREDFPTLDLIARAVLGQDVWLAARALLATWLGNADTAHIRMAAHKRKVLNASTPLESAHPMNPRVLASVRGPLGGIVQQAVITPAPHLPAFNAFESLRQTQGATTMQLAAQNIMAHFEVYRMAWCRRYEDWAKAYAELRGWRAERKVVEYNAAATAFKKITPNTALAIESRFIDGAAPRKSYLFSLAATYAKCSKYGKIALDRVTYASATELARELDAKLRPVITFVQLEAFCFTKLSWFAGDFGVTGSAQAASAIDQEADQGVYDEILESEAEDTPTDGPAAKKARKGKALEVRDIGGVRVVLTKPIPTEYHAIGDLLMADDPPAREPSFFDVLGSYDSDATALGHAVANGYASFEEAYSTLKEGARYDPMSEYTTIGIEAHQAARAPYDDGRILA